MFSQQIPQSSQPMRLQFPTNYHLQQQQQQQQVQQQPQHPMAMPMSFNNHHHNGNNAGTPNNSYAGTIDPGLLQMTLNHNSHLQNMGSLFPSSSASPIASLGNTAGGAKPSGLGSRAGLGSKRNSSSNANSQNIKQETGSPDFLSSEMDFGEPGNMLSPGSNSPLSPPRNDFDSPDDFSATISSHVKPLPMNIQHQQHSYGESPGNGSLYSPVESDFFPEGDFSLPTGSRPLDVKFGRHMQHPGSLQTNPFHSMSMPVPRSDWFGAADGHIVGSFENPSGLQFGAGEMPGMMSSLFEDDADQK
ncbi:hypothetical protein BGZ50_000191 [Haplosporangium sp. Z 11]|nr:hypothetical protein BGZ50_000191 [Haplosporangium sp. Z 11]